MVNEFLPKTLLEALDIRMKHDTVIVAGGTDMLVQNRQTASLPIGFRKDVLFLSSVKELNTIEETKDNLRIGANVTLTTLLEDVKTPLILKLILSEMASPAIRNTATLVGNIANASPAGDSLIGLYLLNTILEIASISHTRFVPIQEFILGVRKIALSKDELITHVLIPKTSFSISKFSKVGGRKADSISKVSFGALANVEHGILKEIRLAFGAVNVTVVRNVALEQTLSGQPLATLSAKIDDIVAQYRPFIKPIDDQRSNANYRLKVSENLLQGFLRELCHIEVMR